MSFRKGKLSFGKHFRLEIHFHFLLLLLAAYLGNYLPFFAISWGSALLHEFCHIWAGKRLGIKVLGITLMPFGCCAPLKNSMIPSPTKEILMAFAGPCMNGILAINFSLFDTFFPHPLFAYGIQVNLALGILNLLPCLPLDGGRVFRAVLTLGSDFLTAYRFTLKVSRFFVCLLFGIGIVLLLTTKFQFSLLLIGAFLLGNLFTEEKNITRQTLEDLLYYEKKLNADTLNHTIIFAACDTLPARKLLHKLSYHRYCIIQVVDKNQKVISTLTESQILRAILHDSIRITLGEIAAQYEDKKNTIFTKKDYE